MGEMFFGHLAEGNEPLFAALTHDPDKATIEIAACDCQGNQFGDSHPSGIEQVQHGLVPDSYGGVGSPCLQQPLHLFLRKRFGQDLSAAGKIYCCKWIPGDKTFPDKKVKKGSEGGDAPAVGFLRGVFSLVALLQKSMYLHELNPVERDWARGDEIRKKKQNVT